MKEIRLYRCVFLKSSGMKPEIPQQDSGVRSFNHHGSEALLKVYEIIYPALRTVNLSVRTDLLINRYNSFSPGKLLYTLLEKIISHARQVYAGKRKEQKKKITQCSKRRKRRGGTKVTASFQQLPANLGGGREKGLSISQGQTERGR